MGAAAEMAIDRFHPGHGQYAQWARMSAEIIESEFLRHQPVTESV
jgi:lysophospholipase L1-like esterase